MCETEPPEEKRPHDALKRSFTLARLQKI
jgi:hypothetical protein